MKEIERAAAMLKAGSMILVYDGDEREGEADLMIHAANAEPETIETLRRDAGGLICVAIAKDIAERMELPFYADILHSSGLGVAKMECTKTAYKDKPAFAIPVNHKGVYTGITDNDRSLTIKKLAELCSKDGKLDGDLVREFYSPGHVFLLIGRGIENRHGHTELSLELARRAGLPGVMVLCEMLGHGKALAKTDAKRYAGEHGFVFLEGKDIVGAGPAKKKEEGSEWL
ncbi:MAG: 3,4-dihydroxy-2-butanone-4-phosphate synthase [Candidatus Micrarchaeota archaeon]